MKILWRSVAALLLVVTVLGNIALADTKIRIGVLKFGTVNWALKLLQEKGLDRAEGIELEVVPLANSNATIVALQGGAVDMIVKDWIWVTRQRAEGKDFTSSPYSMAVGSVMVHPDAGISSVADLAGKRLGVAGGPVDKSWLLLRAYSQKTINKDIADELDPNFAAPPLLNKLILKGDLDAVLNFWHFAARLKAAGMQPILQVTDVLPALGVEGSMPLLGWVFSESWANDNPEAIAGFLRASRKATQMMKTDDALWEGYLRPLTKAKDDNTLMALRDGFRAGVPTQFGDAEVKVAEQVFAILAELGGEKLAGSSTTLAPGTFWAGFRF